MKKLRFKVVYKDSDLIVIDKPAGLLSIPDRYDPTIPNVYNILQTSNKEVYIVHRLDKGTSGIMVFAFTRETHKELSMAFQNREITKNYLCLVFGHLQEKKGEVDEPISKHKSDKSKMQVGYDGKQSISRYKVIEEFANASLLKINILTGRTHQIRVHFGHIGNPMLVDSKYGKYEGFYLSMLKGRKYKRKEEERPLLGRISLHSFELIFVHPGTKEKMTLQAELPKDMRACINQLRKFS